MGGIVLPALPGVNLIRAFKTTAAVSKTVAAQYRPSVWSEPALTMITVPGPYTSVLGASSGSSTDEINASKTYDANGTIHLTTNVKASQVPVQQAPIYLVFDAVMSLGHGGRAVPSRLPIQTSSNLTDHVMLEPDTLSLDVLMTDVLTAYSPGVWVGAATKSISCFQVLQRLRKGRVPLTVTTRLCTYTNMCLTEHPAEDTVKTRYGLRARVQFEQIFVASVATQTYSARPQTTGSTELGTTQPTPVPAGVTAQNGLPSTSTGAPSSSALQQQTGAVPGAGNWSSNNTTTLGGS